MGMLKCAAFASGQNLLAGCRVGMQVNVAFPVVEILSPPVPVHEIDASTGPGGVREQRGSVDFVVGEFFSDETSVVIVSYMPDKSRLFPQSGKSPGCVPPLPVPRNLYSP